MLPGNSKGFGGEYKAGEACFKTSSDTDCSEGLSLLSHWLDSQNFEVLKFSSRAKGFQRYQTAEFQENACKIMQKICPDFHVMLYSHTKALRISRMSDIHH